MIAPLLGLFYFYIGAVLLFYAAIIAGLLMIASLLLLRKTHSVTISGNVALSILWLTVFIISWNTGAVTYEGIIKPSWILNAGLILFAIFLNGYLSGTIWTLLVFLQTGLVIYLYRSGFHFPDLIPPAIASVYSLGTYLIGLLSILVFAFLFEKEKIDALIREQGKSQALRESKRYIDDILERSPTPTFILDKNHRVIQWNAACQDMTCISAAEILGNRVWEGFHVDDRGSLADIVLEDPNGIESLFGPAITARTGNEWYELVMDMPRIEGIQRATITVAPILDNRGMVKGAIQTIQGMNTQERESGISGGGSELGQIEKSLGFPAFKIDSQGKIIFWNQACKESFGYESSQVTGRYALELVFKKYRPVFRETVSDALKGQSSRDKVFKYYGKDGKPIYVLANAYARQSAEGTECIIVNTDITDIKLKNKKLEMYAMETKEKLKNLTEEYNLLKKNIATFIRKKDHTETKPEE